MNHLWKKKLAASVPFVILLIGFSAFAVLCKPAESPIYCNPLGNVTSIPDLLISITKFILQITIPLAGLGIIIAGLNYAFAAASGNPSKAQNAKKILQYVIIGSFVVIGAAALANAAISFIKNLK